MVVAAFGWPLTSKVASFVDQRLTNHPKSAHMLDGIKTKCLSQMAFGVGRKCLARACPRKGISRAVLCHMTSIIFFVVILGVKKNIYIQICLYYNLNFIYFIVILEFHFRRRLRCIFERYVGWFCFCNTRRCVLHVFWFAMCTMQDRLSQPECVQHIYDVFGFRVIRESVLCNGRANKWIK